MLEQLFGSKTRLKLLRILFRAPERSFFVRELSRMLDVQINAVRREIELLLELGLLQEKKDVVPTESSAKPGITLRKYYHINAQCIVYQELQVLLIKEQLMGEEQFIKDIQHKVGNPKLILLSGRFTHDDRAPSDLLIVGDVKERALERMVLEYEKNFGFPIRYTVMTEDEFHDRRYVMDKFIFSLFEAKHVKVVNSLEI